MAQRISQINLTVESNFAQIELIGDYGDNLCYSATTPDEVERMFSDLCTGLRSDMDNCNMVPAGIVESIYSPLIEDWPEFSSIIDDLYLGNYTEDVQDWCNSICNEVDSNPVAYVSDISISFSEEYNDILVGLSWNSYGDNWDRFGLEAEQGTTEYGSSAYSSMRDMLDAIGSEWSESFLSYGIELADDPALDLPDYGPDAERYTILAAFRDLWNGEKYTSNVTYLENYLNDFLANGPEGAYISQIDVEVDPDNNGCLVLRFTWDTYDDPEWNAIIPEQRSGSTEYYSDNYGSVREMFDALSRELQPDFNPAGIGFDYDNVAIHYAATCNPIISPEELKDAFSDLYNGTSYSEYVSPVVNKLEQMLSNMQGHPITEIVYSIGASGGSIAFYAKDFAIGFDISDQDSVLDTFYDIANNLAGECEGSYVVFDPEVDIRIEPDNYNEIDIYEKYDYETLLDIFYNLYNGNVTEQAEKLAMWIASW